MRQLSGALVAMMLLTCGTLFAQIGSEFQVNTYTTNSQDDAYVAVAPDDSFVVVWESYEQLGANGDLFGRRFDAAGTPISSEFQINTYITGYQYDPRVEFDATGAFVVVWQSYGPDGSNVGVAGQRFSSTAVKIGSEFVVNAYTTDYQEDPDLVVNGDGSFVVVWESYGQDGSYDGVFARRFSTSGTPVGSEFQVNQYTTEAQRDPAIARDAAGNFVIVWESYGQFSGDDVLARRFDAAGASLGSEFPVSPTTTGDQRDPEIAMAPDGRFVVVWEDDGRDGSYEGVFAQRFNANGTAAGSEFQVNTYTLGRQDEPRVSLDASGDFAVVWESQDQDGDQDGTFGQRFDAAGTRIGSEFQVNTYTTAGQDSPDVAFFSNGSFVVAWNSYGQDGDYDGIFAALEDRSGFSADLVVTKTSSGGAMVGGQITYTITVQNNGPAEATAVTITDTLPSNVSYSSSSVSQGGGCSESAGIVTCNLGTILSTNTATATIVVTATAPGETINTVVVDSGETDPTPVDSTDSNTVTISPAAAVGADIPTTSELGLMLMALLLAFAGVLFVRRS